MKKIVTLILASILLASCSNTTYKKIDEKQPFIASINIKDTSLTFLTEQYAKLAYWDLDIPFMGGLLLSNRDSILLYGKDMDSIEVYSLSEGKRLDSWKVDKGIVKYEVTSRWKKYCRVNQSLNTVFFLMKRGN